MANVLEGKDKRRRHVQTDRRGDRHRQERRCVHIDRRGEMDIWIEETCTHRQTGDRYTQTDRRHVTHRQETFTCRQTGDRYKHRQTRDMYTWIEETCPHRQEKRQVHIGIEEAEMWP